MAAKIRSVEGEKVVTVVLCWNSDPLLDWMESFGLARNGRQARVSGDYISFISGICEASYNAPGVGSYYWSVCSTGKIGEMLAGLMDVIKHETSITYFHGIGHSLGAHIMGNVWNFGGFKMDRISGLDPAGPCFDGNYGDIEIEEAPRDNRWGLTKYAADFVDSYHTDGDNFGTTKSKGHLNFFAGLYSVN